ncbi:hypothetical protein J4E90_004023 [Alternaria incomplexa]|uniref:uncharacterized protein n=1 Tax=Alternaria incomplexa TaxID=1187928 RepID=UPI00221F96AB|nr:uncharacterized protein J4E90_004023 [Alternaria incomplexa]KAI4915578.1 hypothetical protein J4E90_004023 [Alternaria incomplexa]
MVRRSVRLAKPADQPQVFHDLDTAAVSAKSQKLEEAARARKKRRLEYGESTSSADTMIRDAMAGSDDLRDGHKPALYRGSQLNAQLSADDPRNRFSKLILNGVPESAEWTSIRQTKNYQTNSGVTSVTSPDMRCFQNRPGTGTAVVAAGDNLGFVAETSITHFGPVQFYMAKVPDSANVNTWEPAGNVWFKAASISAVGSPLTSGESTWPAYGKSQVQFQVPKNVPSGKYLVRVESIALHQAQSVGGAQMYLSCAQVEITGGGSGQPGPLVAFPGAYNANDPGLRWSYYPIATSYTAPGPAVWQGN